MAIKYESALKWGDVFYLKNDPDQFEYCLIGIALWPGKPQLVLRHSGEFQVEVYEAETTREPNIRKKLAIDDNPETSPDDEET